MKYAFSFLIILCIGLTTSCEQKTKTSDKEVEKEKSRDTNSSETTQARKLISEIDNNLESLNEVQSLRWEKTTGDNSEFREVQAYMNDQGVPSKIIESFSMGNFKEQGERHYYFQDSEIIAIIKKADEWIDTNTVLYKETETIYEEGKPINSRVRSAEYIDEIDKAKWENIRSISHEAELAIVDNILKGQGKFRTHFISIIKGQDQLFLLLGEPKNENRYVTTVLANPESPFVSDLLNNLDKYKFKPIDLEFQIVGGKGSPKFRLMTDAKWAE